jgi:hypothetical protein
MRKFTTAKAPPKAEPPTCTLEKDDGSGDRCRGPSFDGKTARCEHHRYHDLAGLVGLRSGLSDDRFYVAGRMRKFV